MVRVASLSCFPGAIPREFYGRVPVAEGDDEEAEVRRKKDRVRAQKRRDEARKQNAGMPDEVLSLFKRNGGEV